VRQIIDGVHPTFPLTQKTVIAMSAQFVKHQDALGTILENGVEAFNFEDRKIIQNIIITVSQSND